MAKLNRRTLFLRVEKILIKEEADNKFLDDKEVTKLAVTRYEKLADDVLEELTTFARECNESKNSDAEVDKIVALFRQRRTKQPKTAVQTKSADPPQEKQKESTTEKKKEAIDEPIRVQEKKKMEKEKEKARIEEEKHRLKAEKLKAEEERLRKELKRQKEEEERLKLTAIKKQDEERALKDKIKKQQDDDAKMKQKDKEDAAAKLKQKDKDTKQKDRSRVIIDLEEQTEQHIKAKTKELEKDKQDKAAVKLKDNQKTNKQDTSKTKDDGAKSNSNEIAREKQLAKDKEDEKKRKEEMERQNKMMKENEELKRLVKLKEEETDRLRKEMEKKLVLERKELEKQIEQKIIREKLEAEERLKKDLEETKDLLKKLTLENSSLKTHNTELLKKKRQYEDLNSNLRNEKIKLTDQSLKAEEKLKVSEAEKALAEQKLSSIPLLSGKSSSGAVSLTRVKGVKHVIVDTSILIGRLFDFKHAVKTTKHVYIIPMQVTKELDNLKERKNAPQCPAAREAIRYLATQGRDRIRGQSVSEVMNPSSSQLVPESPDERILLCALYYQTYVADDVLLISDDNNMRARGALHYGLDVMSGHEFTADVLKDVNFSFVSSSADSVPPPKTKTHDTSREVALTASSSAVLAASKARKEMNEKRPPLRGTGTTSARQTSEVAKVNYAARARPYEHKRPALDNNLNATWVPPVPNLQLPVVNAGPPSSMFGDYMNFKPAQAVPRSTAQSRHK